MSGMSISEVARRSGLAASTLRYYERIGLLPPAKRISGRRRYTEQDLVRLAMIRTAKEAGFTLSEVKTLLGGFSDREPPSSRWRAMARRKLPEVEALLARAQKMKRLLEDGLNCHCLRLEECALLVEGY